MHGTIAPAQGEQHQQLTGLGAVPWICFPKETGLADDGIQRQLQRRT